MHYTSSSHTKRQHCGQDTSGAPNSAPKESARSPLTLVNEQRACTRHPGKGSQKTVSTSCDDSQERMDNAEWILESTSVRLLYLPQPESSGPPRVGDLPTSHS